MAAKEEQHSLVAVSWNYLIEITPLDVKLRDLWASIARIRSVPRINHLIMEDDSIMMMSWIEKYERAGATHLLLCNISKLLGCYFGHVCQMVDNVAGWIIFYVARFI